MLVKMWISAYAVSCHTATLTACQRFWMINSDSCVIWKTYYQWQYSVSSSCSSITFACTRLEASIFQTGGKELGQACAKIVSIFSSPQIIFIWGGWWWCLFVPLLPPSSWVNSHNLLTSAASMAKAFIAYKSLSFCFENGTSVLFDSFFLYHYVNREWLFPFLCQ